LQQRININIRNGLYDNNVKRIEWKNSKDRKPLIVWGARQVGKSYLIKDLFAKNYFKEYLYIDLKKDEEALNYFSITANSDKYISFIEMQYKKKLNKDCLLIIDEVQLSHNVLSSLKYFYQDHKEIPVIVTGSLVRLSLLNNKNDNGLFPVGKVNSMTLYPLTFEEYLINANKFLFDKINESYTSMIPLDEGEHKLANNYLYEFLSIGGMPEVVKTFLDNKSYLDASKIQDDVYNDYINDITTYPIPVSMILKIKKVYENIFNQLNKENKNFKLSLIDYKKANRDYTDAYNWLEFSNTVYISHKLKERLTLPLYSDDNLFRIYLIDSGLFAYQSKIKQNTFFVDNERNTLSGIFYENYIANELKSNDIPLFYWKGKNDFEFEFIVQCANSIIPIDVKKGNGKLNSLDNYKSYNKLELAVKFANCKLGYDKNRKILSIPLYMAYLAIKDIKNNNLIKKICD